MENSGYAIGRDWKDHVWPYYAHPDVIKKLDQIGTEYRKNFSYPAFRILAMSLKNGGLLDVKGTWAPPFKYHARGWQVFVAPAEGDTFPDDVAWFFVTNADKYGYNWHPEAVLGAYWLNFSPDRDNQTPALHEDIAAMREHEPALFRK